MAEKLYTKAFYRNGQFEMSDEGDVELPTASALPHRFQMIDGEVSDLYEGLDDDGVRLRDWQRAVDASEEAGDAPPPDFRGSDEE